MDCVSSRAERSLLIPLNQQDLENLSDIDVGEISDVPSNDDFVLYYDGDEDDEDFHDVNIVYFTEDVGPATILDTTATEADIFHLVFNFNYY